MTEIHPNPAIESLKHLARLLHRQGQSGEPKALARLRKHPDFKSSPDDAIHNQVRRRHSLDLIAKETGFPDWPQTVKILAGKEAYDYGTVLHPKGCSAHTNIWFASYDEAQPVRDETDGYLLTYKTQFLIVDQHYIRTLGLDPDDEDWARIGRDWARPADPAARSRLYANLPAFRTQQPEHA